MDFLTVLAVLEFPEHSLPNLPILPSSYELPKVNWQLPYTFNNNLRIIKKRNRGIIESTQRVRPLPRGLVLRGARPESVWPFPLILGFDACPCGHLSPVLVPGIPRDPRDYEESCRKFPVHMRALSRVAGLGSERPKEHLIALGSRIL